MEEKIFKLIGEMRKHLADERRGERLRSGLHLAILGRPNTGKSSFLNALVQRPAAIVSPIPGKILYFFANFCVMASNASYTVDILLSRIW